MADDQLITDGTTNGATTGTSNGTSNGTGGDDGEGVNAPIGSGDRVDTAPTTAHPDKPGGDGRSGQEEGLDQGYAQGRYGQGYDQGDDQGDGQGFGQNGTPPPDDRQQPAPPPPTPGPTLYAQTPEGHWIMQDTDGSRWQVFRNHYGDLDGVPHEGDMPVGASEAEPPELFPEPAPQPPLRDMSAELLDHFKAQRAALVRSKVIAALPNHPDDAIMKAFKAMYFPELGIQGETGAQAPTVTDGEGSQLAPANAAPRAVQVSGMNAGDALSAGNPVATSDNRYVPEAEAKATTKSDEPSTVAPADLATQAKVLFDGYNAPRSRPGTNSRSS